MLLAAGAVALALRGKPAEQAKADPEPPKKPAQKGAPNPNGKAQQQVAEEVVLFDGTAAGLAKLRSQKTGGEANWEVKDGFVVVMPGRGNIYSVEKFRDHAIHLEYWLLPNDKDGNSGVFVQGCYEVSIFDDAGKSSTFVTSGGIYGKHPPLKNASKPAGQWQTLDITFTAARGKQLPRITVVHNGEKVIDDVELADYTPGNAKELLADGAGPLVLQDHGSRVRFRNVRVRRLGAAPVAAQPRDHFLAEVVARGGELSYQGPSDGQMVNVPPLREPIPDDALKIRLSLTTGSSKLPPWVAEPNWNVAKPHSGKVVRPFGAGELAALETFAPGTFQWLILVGQAVPDADLERVIGFPSMRDLTALRVMNCGAGNATVRAAAKLSKLEALDLDGTRVNDDALTHLPGDIKALQRLALRDTHITNGAVAHLKRLGPLKSLDLRGTEVSHAAATELAAALPGCWIAYGADKRIGPAKK